MLWEASATKRMQTVNKIMKPVQCHRDHVFSASIKRNNTMIILVSCKSPLVRHHFQHVHYFSSTQLSDARALSLFCHCKLIWPFPESHCKLGLKFHFFCCLRSILLKNHINQWRDNSFCVCVSMWEILIKSKKSPGLLNKYIFSNGNFKISALYRRTWNQTYFSTSVDERN